MGKDTTLQIKGILILMMLWLHLYSNKDLFDGTCYEFLPVGGINLVHT